MASLLPPVPVSAAQTPSRTINNIEVSGRFLEQWSRPGTERDSVYVNGLPTTPLREEISTEDGKAYPTQWFERARYELHPDNAPPYDLLLGRLGAMLAEGRGSLDPSTGQVRDPADVPFVGVEQPSDTGDEKLWFSETKHTLSGKFLEYWRRYGGLEQFGFPLSEPFEEVSATDGQTYTVQYFERNRFELHPDKPAPYEVELGLLGVQQHRMRPVPASELPIAPPPGVISAKSMYTEGSLQEPDTLFCAEASATVAARFCQAITFQDRLVGMDDKGSYFPLAAWYVPSVENGGTYFVGTGEDRHLVTRYKLRPGIKWSDGVEVTSNDGIFAYKLVLDDPHARNKTLQRKLAYVDNPGKYTLIYNWLSPRQARAVYDNPTTDRAQFDFLKPFVELGRPVSDPDYLYVGMVLPGHKLAAIPVDRIHQSPEYSKPTGYGPYMVEEWRQGDHLTLVRNPNYTLTEQPPLAKIYSQFNTDLNAQTIAYLDGRIDGIARDTLTVPPEQAPQIQAAGGVISVVPGANWHAILPKFNYEPFNDIRVRKALIYAINRPQIIEVAFKGSASLMNGPVPPGVFHSLENPAFARNFPDLAETYRLPTYPYDPTEANRLLDEAGWIAPCGDPSQCVREKDGKKLSFTFGYGRSAARTYASALAFQDLKQVGIDPSTIGYPQHCSWVPGGCEAAVRRADLFDAVILTEAHTSFDMWDSSYINYAEPGYSVNAQGFSSNTVDAANRLFKTSVDPREQAEQSAIIQTELMNNVVVIPIAQRANIEIYSGKLKNRKTPNSTVPGWWNITQWYFEP